MGIPMAMALALAGFTVGLADLLPRPDADWEDLCQKARAEWAMAEQLLADAGMGPGFSGDTGTFPPPVAQRIHLHRGCGPWLEAVDCLFEAVPERPAVKAEAYRQLGAWLRPDCLIGSTTSSLTPDELAPLAPHPERLLVTHWLHPPWLMPLVEVAGGRETAPEALAAMLDLLRRAGKVPVAVAGTPGLIVARLQIPIMNEAARLAAAGVAPAATIDRAVRLGLGFRFLVQGLLEFADTGGVDVLYLAGQHLRTALNDPKFEPGPAVAEQVAQGRLGRKTGRGFYDWSQPGMQEQGQAALRTYLHLLAFCGLIPGSAGNGEGEGRA
jgi:3-hydroxybutyryl-CoA dehydrogenase